MYMYMFVYPHMCVYLYVHMDVSVCMWHICVIWECVQKCDMREMCANINVCDCVCMSFCWYVWVWMRISVKMCRHVLKSVCEWEPKSMSAHVSVCMSVLVCVRRPISVWCGVCVYVCVCVCVHTHIGDCLYEWECVQVPVWWVWSDEHWSSLQPGAPSTGAQRSVFTVTKVSSSCP